MGLSAPPPMSTQNLVGGRPTEETGIGRVSYGWQGPLTPHLGLFCSYERWQKSNTQWGMEAG